MHRKKWSLPVIFLYKNNFLFGINNMQICD